MSSEFVICAYRPKPGEMESFRAALERHLDVLDDRGYLASRQHIVMESPRDGAVLEILEWKSRDAARLAHDDPTVQSVWGQLARSAELIALGDLAEAAETFPHFSLYGGSDSAQG